jgi:taurine dioxygenase
MTPAPAATTPLVNNPLMHYGPRVLNRSAADAPETAYRRISLHPLTTHIGAEVEGADLSAAVDGELAGELRAALLEWKVLFFRGQHGLTPAGQRALVDVWGAPEPNPFFPRGDSVEVSRLAKDATTFGHENIWHSDHSFMAAPAMGAVLRAVEVPPAGGDTMWADMHAVYDNLPGRLKDRVEGLRAVHDWEPSWGVTMTPAQIAALRRTLPAVEHPVVVRHPRTGRKLLYVNEPFTIRIVGLPEDDSRALLSELVLQARVPEYQVRFRWQPGSLAIWDNIATQHYAISDYFPQRRVMERISIAGAALS